MMFTPTRPSGFVRRNLTQLTALSAILGASVAVMSAQTSQTNDESVAPATSQTSSVTAQAGVQAKRTLDLTIPAVSGDAMFSSSNSENEVAVNTDHFNFVNAMQYGGSQHQRYGRPRYRGGNTNADGSNKYDFFAGAGFTAPVGGNSDYLKTAWGIQVGGGRNFNKHVGLNVEFNWDQFGLTGQTLTNQSTLYFGPDPSSPNPNGLDANNHIWSFSIDPIYNLYSGEGLGAYVTGGVGFYHKVTNFTLPQEEESCYYFCEVFEANETVDHYTSNAPGFNAGFGLTYKFSRFSNERFYGEVRYVYIDNSYRAGYTLNNIASAPDTATNLFPQNSQTTSYFPVKFGIRF